MPRQPEAFNRWRVEPNCGRRARGRPNRGPEPVELRGFGKLFRRHSWYRDELGGLSIGAGLVEQQGVDIAGRLDRATGKRKHVELGQAIHASNADRREQGPDGGRNQGDEQGYEHDHRNVAARIGGKARDRHRGEHEDDGQASEQDIERNLVRGLLAHRAFDQGDHAVKSRIAETLLERLSNEPHIRSRRSAPMTRSGESGRILAHQSSHCRSSRPSP
jgi:hypothetical protein